MASLALGFCAGLVHKASGQAIPTLVDFDTVWRYDQSGMEVHQVSLSSSDVVWGARLAAIGPLPLADTRGPVITSAILREDVGSLNGIDVTFDATPTPFNRDDIRVIRSGTFGAGAVAATVENIVYGGRTIRLRVGGPNWDISNDYYILVSNVTDSRGNVIAPLSVFPLTIRGREGLVPTNGPAPLLRLTPTLLAGHPPRLKLTWPSNAHDVYYGYSLKEAKVLTSSDPARVFSVVPNQANGVIVPATNAARYYRLERGPNSGR